MQVKQENGAVRFALRCSLRDSTHARGLLPRGGEEYTVGQDQTQRGDDGDHEVVDSGRVDEEVRQPQQRQEPQRPPRPPLPFPEVPEEDDQNEGVEANPGEAKSPENPGNVTGRKGRLDHYRKGREGKYQSSEQTQDRTYQNDNPAVPLVTPR